MACPRCRRAEVLVMGKLSRTKGASFERKLRTREASARKAT